MIDNVITMKGQAFFSELDPPTMRRCSSKLRVFRGPAPQGKFSSLADTTGCVTGTGVDGLVVVLGLVVVVVLGFSVVDGFVVVASVGFGLVVGGALHQGDVDVLGS